MFVGDLMKVVVLGSSSSGNSTFVNINNIKFLIDAGLPFGKLKDALYRLRKSWKKNLLFVMGEKDGNGLCEAQREV